MGKITSSGYISATRNNPPRQIVMDVATHVLRKDKALDLGAGALNETRWLLEQGFAVDAVDFAPAASEEASKIDSDDLTFMLSRLEDFSFQPQTYDFVIAVNVLHFLPDDVCQRVVEDAVKALRPEGIFFCRLFGDRLEPVMKNHVNMFCRTKSEVADLFSNFNVINEDDDNSEGENDKRHPVNAEVTHYHWFDVVIQK